jgi:hypothetical protein
MNPDQNNPTTDNHWLPELVRAGLDRCADERARAPELPSGTAAEWAVRTERQAAIVAREGRWWAVLSRWAYRQAHRPGGIAVVFARAAVMAVQDREQRARLLRDMAADWRRRAAGEPMCPVIGCGGGGTDECEVAA